MYRLDTDNILRVPGLEAFSWLEHGFGTRKTDAWPSEDHRATLRQIHSTRVAVANTAGTHGDGDALITDTPGLFVAVKTADCVPVLLVDSERRIVAAAHAGWRGTAGNIVRSTIDTMVSQFHTDPQSLWAAIGPGIRKCCYEVNGDVAGQFARWIPELTSNQQTSLDLALINRLQLIASGVRPDRVLGGSNWCTQCEIGMLHSFRRDKELSGRMLSAIRVLDR